MLRTCRLSSQYNPNIAVFDIFVSQTHIDVNCIKADISSEFELTFSIWYGVDDCVDGGFSEDKVHYLNLGGSGNKTERVNVEYRFNINDRYYCEWDERYEYITSREISNVWLSAEDSNIKVFYNVTYL